MRLDVKSGCLPAALDRGTDRGAPLGVLNTMLNTLKHEELLNTILNTLMQQHGRKPRKGSYLLLCIYLLKNSSYGDRLRTDPRFQHNNSWTSALLKRS